MRLFGKIVGYGLLVVVVLAATGITFTIGWRPFIGPKARPTSDRKFEATPERLARGKYLSETVSGCMDCHSDRDWTQHEAPMKPGREGAGQFIDLKVLPGKVYAPNLTPDPENGAGRWTDDQLARAIREGIGHDGRALFPFMPYQNFRHFSDEDLASIIVYLRSLSPVRLAQPPIQLEFPVNYLIRSVPETLTAPVPPPDLSTPVKRGEWLATVANCSDCHTPQDAHGLPLENLRYGGGFVLEGPWGRAASANLTPDASGISYYDETLFVQAMRTGYVRTRKLSQIMPWHEFRHMTGEDLSALFAYLKTLKPVSHRVDNTEEATLCPLCKLKHGYGSKN